jgi:hypothetical protein
MDLENRNGKTAIGISYEKSADERSRTFKSVSSQVPEQRYTEAPIHLMLFLVAPEGFYLGEGNIKSPILP